MNLKSGLIREVAYNKKGLIREVAYNGKGLIRGEPLYDNSWSTHIPSSGLSSVYHTLNLLGWSASISSNSVLSKISSSVWNLFFNIFSKWKAHILFFTYLVSERSWVWSLIWQTKDYKMVFVILHVLVRTFYSRIIRDLTHPHKNSFYSLTCTSLMIFWSNVYCMWWVLLSMYYKYQLFTPEL